MAREGRDFQVSLRLGCIGKRIKRPRQRNDPGVGQENGPATRPTDLQEEAVKTMLRQAKLLCAECM